jgi:CTD kinase subunit alpha
MVFEYMDHDLAGILSHPTFVFAPAHIKELLRQMLEGLHYLHHRGILHRDIKGSNILLSASGQLKLADFGLARHYHKRRDNLDYSNRVITLWYRPPELLLGATAYGPAVDIWSIGCIMLEMVMKKALFPGSDEIDQLKKIWDIMGSPTPEIWPKVTELPWWEIVKPYPSTIGRFHQDFAWYF